MTQSKSDTTDVAAKAEISATDRGRWLRMYRKMLEIRLFEEQVNMLYTRPGCPAWRISILEKKPSRSASARPSHVDDYITSTHRGHGHCLAKGAESSACSPNCWARKPAIAGAKAGRCTCRSGPRQSGRQCHRGGQYGHCRRRRALRQACGGRGRFRLLLWRRSFGAGPSLRSDEHGVALEASR